MLSSVLVLSMMLLAVPSPPASVRATYDATADAIAEAAEASPLFAGQDGPARTAALLVAVAKFESGMRPDAAGDCDKTLANGMCASGSRPHSFCLLQVSETNFAYLRTSRAAVQEDVRECVRAGLSMMRDSFRICSRAPLESKLSWYASGGGMCLANDDAVKKSRHRMALAKWVYDRAEKAVREPESSGG